MLPATDLYVLRVHCLGGLALQAPDQLASGRKDETLSKGAGHGRHYAAGVHPFG
jgi:hypothetical protein